jgi:retron-type reverse transcriptase
MRGFSGSVTATRITTTRITQGSSVVSGVKVSFPNPYPCSLEDVFDAYFTCRKQKRNSHSQLAFEMHLETNIVQLWRDLNAGTYRIGRSIAFVVQHPKIREVWAADFRDRVVHHLIYNILRSHLEKRFIRDSYACIPGRGLHDGMRRVSHFARSITRNYTRSAYAMKADVSNFFNGIDQNRLMEILARQTDNKELLSLIAQVVYHNPRHDVMLQSSKELFSKVPTHKSYLKAATGKGLPIGNLTSQFFANVYMNELDQFVKHTLKAKYYGRYVDDFILFHEDKDVLNAWYERIETFLAQNLSLRLHNHKKWINHAHAGIDFVGFIIKPGRTYLRQTSLSRCKQKIRAWQMKGASIDEGTLQNLSASVTSYLGMLRQVNGYKARKSLCRRVESLFIRADKDCTKILTAEGAYEHRT